MKLFSDSYRDTRSALASTTFSSDNGWDKTIAALRELVQQDGLKKTKSGALDDLRKRIKSGSKGGQS